MSEQKVKDAYPGKVVSIKQAEEWTDISSRGTRGEIISSSCFDFKPEDKCTSLAMKDFKIFGKDFNVFFYFTDNQLSNVKLICDAPPKKFHQAEECLDDANQLLTQKYGEYTEIEAKKTPTKYKYNDIPEKKKWKAGHNNIVTAYSGCITCGDNRGAAMKIIYSPDLQQVPLKSNFYEKNKDKI